jgi:catechol 2,3-dioxygenase-like lactoylglutathione lyase family enzyme
MNLKFGMVTIVVDDYDIAISHYVTDLGFHLIEDTQIDTAKRWVVVSPGQQGAKILLAKASTPEQISAIGNSTAGRVAFFLYTDDFQNVYANYKNAGVEFTEEPRSETFGKVVVFKDAYGNKWDLIENR